MRLVLRLYRQHDLDLIALHKNKGFCFSTAIREAIYAYTHAEQLSILAPGPTKMPDEKIPREVFLIVRLDEKDDSEIIEWIKNIKPGYRNSCLKNLIRGYLVYPVVYPYIDASRYNEVEKNNVIFKSNIKRYKKIPGKSNYKKKTKKTDIADEILSDAKEKDDKEMSIYVENVEKEVDPVKTEKEVFKSSKPDIDEKPDEKVTNEQSEYIDDEAVSDEENDEMFDTFENMLKNF